MSATIKYASIIIALLSAAFLSLEAYCGTIRTKVICRSQMDADGSIVIEGDIENLGDATAYSVNVTVLLADWADRLDHLGDNRNGGSVHLKTRYQNPYLLPGGYTVIIQVTFEDQSGKRHRVNRYFSMLYKLEENNLLQPALTLEIKTPTFNKRAFWRQSDVLRLLLINEHHTRIYPKVSIFLPQGFHSTQTNSNVALLPDEKKIINIPLEFDPSIRQETKYFVVSSYAHDGIHYSQAQKDFIQVIERPIIFKWYIVLAVSFIFAFFCFTFFRNR
jgi:hypothetical protein